MTEFVGYLFVGLLWGVAIVTLAATIIGEVRKR